MSGSSRAKASNAIVANVGFFADALAEAEEEAERGRALVRQLSAQMKAQAAQLERVEPVLRAAREDVAARVALAGDGAPANVERARVAQDALFSAFETLDGAPLV